MIWNNYPSEPSFRKFAVVFILNLCTLTLLAQRESALVFADTQDLLRYVSDEEGNYVPDFSYAGYRNGEHEIPEVPVIMTIGPIAGDNTTHIQNAVDKIGTMAVDSLGVRGALLLQAGTYFIDGIVRISHSGVVLRGVGEGEDANSNTILIARGNTPENRDVIQVGARTARDWRDRVSGTTSMVTSPYLPVGVKTISLTDIERWNVGDHLVLYHPSTDAWLQTINYGDTDSDDPWREGDLDLYYYRQIIAVDLLEEKITLDVPIYDHLDLALSQAVVYQPDRSDLRDHIGVENLRIVIETQGVEDEVHAKNGVKFINVEDCWANQVTVLHFTYAGFDTRFANRVSVLNCNALEPHSLITGARRYNFAVGAWSNNILFQDCFATEGRHSFVSNGASTVSGVVFHRSESDIDYSASEGHRRWSQALLFDNLRFTNSETRNVLGLYNRGDFGTGHGWSTVHGVAWNVSVPLNRGIIIQKPPLRQNYAVGCRGIFSNAPPFQHPKGVVEIPNREPIPVSLYEQQLAYRLAGNVTLDVPAKLTVQLIDSMVSLTWLDISSEEISYVIEMEDETVGQFAEVVELPANTNEYRLIPPSDMSTSLKFRAYAKNGHGVSPYSNPVTLDLTTDVRLLDQTAFQVVPNPFIDKFQIKSDLMDAEVKIYNGSGKIITRSSLSEKEIDSSSWPAGIYFMKIRDKQGRFGIKKLIKL